jgi:hypothetical protein
MFSAWCLNTWPPQKSKMHNLKIFVCNKIIDQLPDSRVFGRVNVLLTSKDVISSYLWGGGRMLQKSPVKSCRWDLFAEPDCVTSVRWAQLRITFYLRKNNCPRKFEMFYITFDCYHFNQKRTRPGPEHHLCYQAQAWPWARIRPRREGQTPARANL